MRKFAYTGLIAAAALSLSACGDTEVEDVNAAAADNALTGASTDDPAAAAGGSAGAADDWEGARIVEENGTTYRVNADGSRVALGPNDSRIVVEDNVRYRVDPDGTRVRIGEDGIRVDGPDVDLPDVDVGVNEKGNLDVDVGDRDPDGGR